MMTSLFLKVLRKQNFIIKFILDNDQTLHFMPTEIKV